MRPLTSHKTKHHPALYLPELLGKRMQARASSSGRSSSASLRLVGGEISHQYHHPFPQASGSGLIWDIQNQALCKMLADYKKQIECLKGALVSLRQSLSELQQQVAQSSTGAVHTAGLRDELDIQLGRLIKRVSRDSTAWDIPEPVVITCTMLRSTYPQLTRSESKVAAYILCGLATADIAMVFSVSERTIENHRMHIRQKLAVNGKKSLKVFLERSLT